jgi:putative FmdB family regulatory protein
MPIYEYKCGACGQRFEKLQKFSDAPLTTCECGKEGSVTRLITPPAFHLKGGGWYKDGYGSGSSGKAGSGAAASKSTDSTPASGGDTKPATPAASSSSSDTK